MLDRRHAPGHGRAWTRSLPRGPAAGVNATEINTRLVRVLAAGVNATDVRHRAPAAYRGRRLERADAVPLHPGHRLLRPRRRGRAGRRSGLVGPPRPRAALHAPAGLRRRRRPSGWAPTSTAPSPSSCSRRRPRSSRWTATSATPSWRRPLRLRDGREHAARAPACGRAGTSSSPAPPAASARPPCSSRGCAAPRSRRSTTADKAEQVRALGADRVVDRDDDVAAVLGERSVDVVVDNVSGPGLDGLLDVLRRGGSLRLVRRHRRPDGRPSTSARSTCAT